MSRRFRLGVVLRLREMAEETARIDLGHALEGHRRAVLSVEVAEGAAGAEMRWFSDLQRVGADAGQLQSAASAVAAAQRGIAAAQEKLAAATKALFEARRSLAEASRQREVVERLRDRYTAAERREAERLDIVNMAEIASTQHAMRAVRERQ